MFPQIAIEKLFEAAAAAERKWLIDWIYYIHVQSGCFVRKFARECQMDSIFIQFSWKIIISLNSQNISFKPIFHRRKAFVQFVTALPVGIQPDTFHFVDSPSWKLSTHCCCVGASLGGGDENSTVMSHILWNVTVSTVKGMGVI